MYLHANGSALPLACLTIPSRAWQLWILKASHWPAGWAHSRCHHQPLVVGFNAKHHHLPILGANLAMPSLSLFVEPHNTMITNLSVWLTIPNEQYQPNSRIGNLFLKHSQVHSRTQTSVSEVPLCYAVQCSGADELPFTGVVLFQGLNFRLSYSRESWYLLILNKI